MLHRRHIITHNGVRVDGDYLKSSGDSKARLNERIRIRSSQIRHLLETIKLLSNNVILGVQSIA
jgi:hypothetical protein